MCHRLEDSPSLGVTWCRLMVTRVFIKPCPKTYP